MDKSLVDLSHANGGFAVDFVCAILFSPVFSPSPNSRGIANQLDMPRKNLAVASTNTWFYMSEHPKDKILPRDAAGSIDLEGGTGGITGMCSCDEFLEVYKEDATFRVKTPDSIDPDRTNPNAPFVAEFADTVGSSSHVVARVLLQGRDIIEAAIFDRDIDKAAIIGLLHATKECLVVCEKVAKRVTGQVDMIIKEIEDRGISRSKDGRTLNPFPRVSDLEADTTAFLINAKRAIQSMCRLPSLFLPVEPKEPLINWSSH